MSITSTQSPAGTRGVSGQRAMMLETLVRNLRMVRLRAAVVMAASIAVSSGCTGSIGDDGGGGDGDTEEQIAAKLAWSQPGGAYDALAGASAACVTCHKSEPTYPYLEGATVDADLGLRDRIRLQILNFPTPIVNLEAPGSSRLLIKGPHNGAPALIDDQPSIILDWINKEQIAAGITTGVSEIFVTPFDVLPGQANFVSLSGLGLEGASITFDAQLLSSMLYLTSLKVNPGPAGVHIVHPLFSSWPDGEDPQPDPIDTFFKTEINAQMSDGPQLLNAGAAGFSTFLPTNKLGISFELVEGWVEGVEPPVDDGLCKNLSDAKGWVTEVKPLLANCVGCHSGGTAIGAVDMSKFGTDDIFSCAQILSRTSTTDIPSSGILRIPDPALAGHTQYKVPAGQFGNYETKITEWIETERDAE